MEEAEDLAQLLRGATLPSSLRVQYRVWHDHGLAAAARDADRPPSGGRERHAERLPAGAEARSETEISVSIWRAAPDRLRVQFTGGAQDGAIGVRVGDRWWSASPGQGLLTSEESPADASWPGRGVESFLDPAVLAGAMCFTSRGHGRRAGRPVIIAEAIPTGSGPNRAVPAVLGAHADRYRVEVDADRGLVMSVHAYLNDRAFQTIDVTELEIDEPLSPELFQLPAP